MYEFCKEKLEVTNSEKGKTFNQLFFFVSKDDIAAYHENFPSSGIYKHIPGTRKIHQLFNQLLLDSGVYKWCTYFWKTFDLLHFCKLFFDSVLLFQLKNRQILVFVSIFRPFHAFQKCVMYIWFWPTISSGIHFW